MSVDPVSNQSATPPQREVSEEKPVESDKRAESPPAESAPPPKQVSQLPAGVGAYLNLSA